MAIQAPGPLVIWSKLEMMVEWKYKESNPPRPIEAYVEPISISYMIIIFITGNEPQ